jgi:hypothetical protein
VSKRSCARRLAAISVLALPPFTPYCFADRDANLGCETRSRTFATQLDAVYALSTCYAERSVDEDREYFAAILRTADGYLFVVGAGSLGVDQVSLRFERRAGETFVAAWHTHGAHGPYRELFSPTDTALVKRVGVPFYLTDPNGNVRVFRPGDYARVPKDRLTMRRPPSGAAAGTLLASKFDASASAPESASDRQRNFAWFGCGDILQREGTQRSGSVPTRCVPRSPTPDTGVRLDIARVW